MPKCGKLTRPSPSGHSCGHSNTIYDVQLQKVIVLRTQPWNQETFIDAATTMRLADIALQNTIQLCTTAQETAGPKPDLDAKAEKCTIFMAKTFIRKIISAKMQKI